MEIQMARSCSRFMRARAPSTDLGRKSRTRKCFVTPSSSGFLTSSSQRYPPGRGPEELGWDQAVWHCPRVLDDWDELPSAIRSRGDGKDPAEPDAHLAGVALSNTAASVGVEGAVGTMSSSRPGDKDDVDKTSGADVYLLLGKISGADKIE